MSIYENEINEIRQRKENRDKKRAFWWSYRRNRARIRINLDNYGLFSFYKPRKFTKIMLKNYGTLFFLSECVPMFPGPNKHMRLKELIKTKEDFICFSVTINPKKLTEIYDVTNKELRSMYAEILRDERCEWQKQKEIMWNCHHYGITKTESERCYLGKVDLEKEGNIDFSTNEWTFKHSDWWRDHTVKDRKKMTTEITSISILVADDLDIYPEEFYRLFQVHKSALYIEKNFDKIKNESWWKLDRVDEGLYRQMIGRLSRDGEVFMSGLEFVDPSRVWSPNE